MAKRCTSFFHFVFLLLLALVALQLVDADLPPVFIFGDSTFDVGTNNFLPESRAKANFPFNGIDYPLSAATGRFSNGYNSADHIVKLLGYKKSPLPYFNLTNRMISFKKNIVELGVNFASGGSGILNTTGSQFGEVVTLEEQIQQFVTVWGNYSDYFGPDAAAKKLSQSLFLISVGSNDIFEYEVFNSTNESAAAFMGNLEYYFRVHLTSLHRLGARKFAIISIPPIGCCPAQRAHNITGGCITGSNVIAQTFYEVTKAILQDLSSNLQGMSYSLGDAYSMAMSIINNASLGGVKNVLSACCGDGNYPCNQTATLCLYPKDYFFWDMFHPTDKIANAAAHILYSGPPPLVTPMNFSQLALINL